MSMIKQNYLYIGRWFNLKDLILHMDFLRAQLPCRQEVNRWIEYIQ